MSTSKRGGDSRRVNVDGEQRLVNVTGVRGLSSAVRTQAGAKHFGVKPVASAGLLGGARPASSVEIRASRA